LKSLEHSLLGLWRITLVKEFNELESIVEPVTSVSVQVKLRCFGRDLM
jgi:hypothetical protein